MGRLIVLRLGWWPKGTHRCVAWIMVTLFLPWLKWPRLDYSSLWLLFAIGPFISLTSRMLSSMVISLKRFIWSNLLDLLLRGSLLDLFVVFGNLCMGSSNLLGLGLGDLALLFSSLV